LFSQTSGRRRDSGFVNIGDGVSCDAFPNVNDESSTTSSVSKDIEGRKEPKQQKERISIVFKRA
jgi:hypothetical protein